MQVKVQNLYLEFDPPLATDEQMDWLRRRQQGIGGSDAGPIMGVSKYSGPYNVYVDKTTEPVDEPNEAMFWGNRLEHIIVDEFINRFGINCDCVALKPELQHAEYEWMRANLDAMVIDDQIEGSFVVEAKNVSFHVMDDWGDDFVPDHIYAQCQHNMIVSALKKCYLVALMGGNKLDIYRVVYDDEYCQRLIEEEQNFWFNHVMQRVPPDPDHTSRDTLLRQFPQAEPETEKPDARIDMLVEQLESFKEEEKGAGEEAESVKNQIALICADNEEACGLFRRVKWKNVKGRKSFNKARFIKENPGINLEDYYDEGKSTRRLSVE